MNENEQPDSKKVRPDFYGAQFEKAAGFSQDYLGVARALQTDSLRPIAESFENAMSRLRAMAKLPARTAIASGAITAGIIGMFHQLQSAFPGESLGDIFNNIKIKVDGLLKECEKSGKDPIEELDKILPGISSIRDSAKELGERLEEAVPSVSQGIAKTKFVATAEGLHAIHVAQVTGSWTAFETLAGDAWISAVNEAPYELIPHMAPADQKSTPKSISFQMLCKYKFDLTSSMGSVMAETQKVSFKTLEDIRDAYKSLFKDVPAITDALSDNELGTLHAVRNAIVHRGGFADKMFCDRVGQQKPWCDLKIGDELPIDGEVVANLTNVAIRAVVALLREVDSWLIMNRRTA